MAIVVEPVWETIVPARLVGGRTEYDHQLHAVLLRTMRAVLGTERAPRGTVHPAAPEIEDELERVERELAALDGDERPMQALAQRLGWTAQEIAFVWAAVALAVNPRMLVHARGLDDSATRGLSIGLFSRIAGLAPDAARTLGLAFLPGHSAARSGLLYAATGEHTPSALPWVPAPELVRFLAGEPTSSGLLVEIEAPVDGVVLDPAQRAAVERISAMLYSGQRMVLHVEGPALTGRRTAVALASAGPVLALDIGQLAPTPASLHDALVALRREAALCGAVPVIAGVEELVSAEGGRDPRLRVLTQQLELVNGPVVLVTTWRGLDVGGGAVPVVRVEWPIPDAVTRAELWCAFAGRGDAACDPLAHRFRIGAGAIRRAAASARVLAGRTTGALTAAELQAGVRQNIAERMGELAKRVVVNQSWDDLVLADDVMAQVQALVGRIQHGHRVYEDWGYRSKMPRGVGVAALFSGPPGTGKTMVAGIIAAQLDLELYQVDLSSVVSKWVGETEKQLAKVFDAAEAGHVLLLFDEADALFGKRSSEMRGANDRYANLEVNFLLQRIESFNGIAILTTNLDATIDKALKRRLAAHVVFQHPDDDERVRLWDRLLSADAPLAADIDSYALAQYFPAMSGANIRNAALGAAFLTAAEGRHTIDNATVMRAARSEYLSMGHVLANPPLR
jgi:AAA+ superfamily predicted ATPase